MPQKDDQTSAIVHRPHVLATVIAWVLVLAVAGFACVWFVLPYVQGSSTSSNTGYILMSLGTTKGTEHPYMMDVAADAFDRATGQGFTPSSSVDGRYFVWVGGLSVPGHQDLEAIILYDRQTSTSTVFTLGGGIPEVPQVSPDDSAVTYMALSNTATSTSTFFTPSYWNIYTAKEGQVAGVVTHGAYPHWSPDGSSILYVADDGLHQYVLTSGNDTLVWPVVGKATSMRMMLTVSKDGTMFAWTNPLHEQILVASIISWSPFSAREQTRIPVFAFWPVFSPDDTELAFEQVNWSTNPTAQPSNPRLTVYNLKTGRMRELVNLSPFDQTKMFVSDWAVNL